MADHEARPSSPTKLDDRRLDFAVSTLAWMRQCNQDTKQQIAGTKHEIATSHALLTEVDRVLARR